MNFKKILPLLAIIIIVILVFFPSLQGGYLNYYDDNLQILNNPDVLSFSWQSVKNYFTSFYVLSYQPLASLSFGLEYYFFGSNPFVPHVTNLVLHLLNVTVVFFLLNKLTPQLKILNIFILAVFAIHPLQGELLGWISTRSTLIVSFFFLLSCLYYVKYVKSKNRSVKYLWISFLFFVGALFSKSSVIVFPFVLLSFDYLYRRKWAIKLLVEKIPFFIGSFTLGMVSLLSRNVIESTGEGSFYAYYNVYERLSLSSQSIFLYLKKSFITNDLGIFYGYPYRIGEDGNIGFSFLIAPLLIVLIAVFCWVIYKNISKEYKRLWVFGFVFFLINVFIVINIISFSATFFAERYLYIGIIGIFISVSTLAHALIKHTPLLKYGVYTLLVIFLFHLGRVSNDRASLWKSDLTLWIHVVKSKSQSSYPYKILGKIYAKNEHHNKAVNIYNDGILANPYNIDLYYWRALTIVQMGDLNYAIKDFNRVIAGKHKLKGEAFYQKSLLFKQMNLKDSAKISLDSAKYYNVQEAIFEEKDSPLNINRFQKLEKKTLKRIDSLIKIKNYEKVLENYKTLILIIPNEIKYQIEKGKIEFQLQKWNASIQTFTKVLELNPKNEIARLNRAYAYFTTRNNIAAISDYTFVIKDLVVERGDVYYYRALAYFNDKKTSLGCNDIDKARKLGYAIPKEINDKVCK